MTGQIIAFYQKWGWIQGEDRDYYFHVSNCRGYSPKLGEKVTFEQGPSFVLNKPPQAVRVRAAQNGGGVQS